MKKICDACGKELEDEEHPYLFNDELWCRECFEKYEAIGDMEYERQKEEGLYE
jgi:hydrogenase maturation factor HypF (carbamoyltransferase family)